MQIFSHDTFFHSFYSTKYSTMVKSSDAESTKTAINSSYTQSTRTFNDTNHDEDTSTNSFSTSKLLETQECDGPCHKIINYSDLHIFSCGHVLCANCCSELTTKGKT